MRGQKKSFRDVRCCAIIVAAGKSSRMGEAVNKQYIDILGKPLLSYTIDPFEECELIDEIIIVTRQEDLIRCNDQIVRQFGFSKVSNIVVGGNERQNSVYNGLCELKECDIVIIHDGARPLVTIDEIENTIYECIESKAVTLGVKVKDTIKETGENGLVKRTLNRENLWTIQTPQAFEYEIIMGAHKRALEDEFVSTDDSSLVERLGRDVKVIEGSYQNIKVTTSEDINIVESILQNRF